MQTDRAITPPAYAARLGIHVARVLAWIRAGELAAIDVGDRTRPRWRILPDAIAQFERRRAAKPPAPPAPRRKKDPAITEYF